MGYVVIAFLAVIMAETLFFYDLNALNDWNGLNQQHLAFG